MGEAGGGGIYERGLGRRRANHVPLSPLTFLERTAAVWPERTATIHGDRRRSWRETASRCRRLASALAGRGLARGDTVAILAPNLPEFVEASFAVPMAGCVLNAINTRLDAEAIAFILDHGEAKALIADGGFADVVAVAVARLRRRPLVVWIDDGEAAGPVGAAGDGGGRGGPAAGGGALAGLSARLPAGRRRSQGGGDADGAEGSALAVAARASGGRGGSAAGGGALAGLSARLPAGRRRSQGGAEAGGGVDGAEGGASAVAARASGGRGGPAAEGGALAGLAAPRAGGPPMNFSSPAGRRRSQGGGGADGAEARGGGEAVGYEVLLEEGDVGAFFDEPGDEWQAISLNYTSGTTGDPKGVVYHHRGAYLNAVGNALTWAMPQFPVYLWTLPMFHCNGWCFPWTVTAMAGTHVCLRGVSAEAVLGAIARERVTHLCGAPIVMTMMLEGDEALWKAIRHPVKMMTAGAAPPAAVLERMEARGIEVTHVYGLTETYGPAMVCAWHPQWDGLPAAEKAAAKARQGVRYPVQEEVAVADPETLEPVPADGKTMGEILMRGNITMAGYLKNPEATDKAFAGGWFHSGDLAVRHEDGYVEIRDRAKDIVISGGENISTIEVEGVLYRHPDVAEAAVVARPDERWGETPCAFVTLRPGAGATAEELIAFCRERLAHFKCPRHVVFAELPKTSTGKVRKYELRERARALRGRGV